MKVLSLIFVKYVPGNSYLLHSQFYLSSFSFFQRGSIQEVCCFASREAVQRVGSKVGKGGALTVQYQNYVCHCRILPTGLAAVCVTDDEYPMLVAYSLLKEALQTFNTHHKETAWTSTNTDLSLSTPNTDNLLKKYQDPTEADKLLKIQKDLDETKLILVKSMEDLLQRGEKLEDLLVASNDLSFQSKAFAKKSAELNSCCTLL